MPLQPQPHSRSASPLAERPLCFADAQEQAAALSGWNQDYVQLSAGAFQGTLAQVQGAGIRLFVERVQQSVLQTGQLPGHVLALGVPLAASGGGMFCGRLCDMDSLHLFSGDAGFAFRTAREHTMLGLELQWDGALERPLQPAALGPGVRPSALRPYLLALYQSARRDPQLLRQPAVVAGVRDQVLESLLREGDAAGPHPGSHASHWSLVQACVERIHAAQTSPSVTQLCLDLGVSRRTLQNAFHKVLGMSPLAYVKVARLKRARQALKQARCVTEAATACGFWHFGHFAHDYQTLFGEKPSDTLRRAR